MANVLNSIKKSIEAKVVKNRVENFINKIDDDSFDKIAKANIDVITEAFLITSKMVKNVIKSTKPTIIKLAEKNSSQIIKLNDCLNEIKDIIESLDTNDNRKIVIELKNEIKDMYKSYDIDKFDTALNKLDKEYINIIKPFKTDKTDKISKENK